MQIDNFLLLLQCKTITIMTIQDIKISRASKEMILYRREIEKKIQECRSFSEYKKLEKIAKLIDIKLK